MGADMLVAEIGFRRGLTLADFRRGVERVLANAAAKIRAAASLGDLGEYRERFLDGDARDDPSLDEIKATLLQDVEAVREGALEGHRHACLIDGGAGISLLVSGGLSWGDTPSEIYDSIERLQAAGVVADARLHKGKRPGQPGLPPLRGTRRQVAWAARARTEVLPVIEELYSELLGRAEAGDPHDFVGRGERCLLRWSREREAAKWIEQWHCVKDFADKDEIRDVAKFRMERMPKRRGKPKARKQESAPSLAQN